MHLCPFRFAPNVWLLLLTRLVMVRLGPGAHFVMGSGHASPSMAARSTAQLSSMLLVPVFPETVHASAVLSASRGACTTCTRDPSDPSSALGIQVLTHFMGGNAPQGRGGPQPNEQGILSGTVNLHARRSSTGNALPGKLSSLN
eukprot:scaffold231536_cov18-Tisochrysis_lutea.AAC.1